MIRRRAFSMAELLIVIAIIVLMLALAVPAFNFITGSKSEASANNQIAAILGRARAEAIGLPPSPHGVFFFTDPSNNRCVAMPIELKGLEAWVSGESYIVGQYVLNSNKVYVCITDANGLTTPPTDTATDPNWRRVFKPVDVDVVDAIVPGADSVTLPSGVAMQMLCDSKFNVSTNRRTSDGYLRCGAILFDSTGRLVMNRSMMVSANGILGQKMGLTNDYPNTGNLESSCGYVLYDRDALASQSFFSEGDFAVTDTRFTTPTQANEIGLSATADCEEHWLDENGSAVIVNRYNGTLIKGQ